GLDVYEIEPLPDNHKLWSLDNVMLTPHIAVAEAVNLNNRRYEILENNAKLFLKNQDLINVVDKEKWF
ncbi:MAG: hydroxyacid dehydrogenase, partial [Chloroflexi bacterium]|nr:hydroxyacid dehydrogenase [Chloroflexota bacterium]